MEVLDEVTELVERAGDVLVDANLEYTVNHAQSTDHVIAGPLSLGSRFARDQRLLTVFVHRITHLISRRKCRILL